MGLLDNISKMKLGFQGKNLPSYGSTGNKSRLHYTYSLNGDPQVLISPSPSSLDLEGKIPVTNYRDNAPEGATF